MTLGQPVTISTGPYRGKRATILEIDRLAGHVWLMFEDRSVEVFGAFEIGKKFRRNEVFA